MFKHTNPWETFIFKLQWTGSPTEPESRLLDSTSQLSPVSTSHIEVICVYGYTQLFMWVLGFEFMSHAYIANDLSTELFLQPYFVLDTSILWTLETNEQTKNSHSVTEAFFPAHQALLCCSLREHGKPPEGGMPALLTHCTAAGLGSPPASAAGAKSLGPSDTSWFLGSWRAQA